jgi:hypothetical protein
VNPKVALERITTVKRVWSTLRPNSSFYGMTLEEFGLRVKPSLDARAELESIDEHRNATAVRRDAADVEAMDVIQHIVNAIKADPNEGEDGEVYAALGYVRKGQRANGRLRNRVTASAQANSSQASNPQASEVPSAAEQGASKKEAA